MSTSHADSSRIELDSTPLVSIVMPTYNRAHLVGEAIDAVLAQTYPHFELILVNDGSRDNTREVLDAYAARDPRIRVIHKENEGIPDTVNRGWRESRGELVTWTSDDNNYHPTAIETMVHYLQANPDVGLVYTDCRNIDALGADLGLRPGGDPDSLEYDCPIMGCLLFRRPILDRTDGFRRQWKRCHDFEFYRRVWRVMPVRRIPEILYDYRVHSASMSGDYFALRTEVARVLEADPGEQVDRSAIWANCWSDVAKQCERDGREWAAVGYRLRESLRRPRGFKIALRVLVQTSYRSLPAPIQNAWRAIKSAGASS